MRSTQGFKESRAENWPHQELVIWPWIRYLASLILNYLIYEENWAVRFFMFIYLWEREGGRYRAQVGEGQREKEGDTESEAGSVLTAQTHEPWDHDLSRGRTLNGLSHPDAPKLFQSFDLWAPPGLSYFHGGRETMEESFYVSLSSFQVQSKLFFFL